MINGYAEKTIDNRNSKNFFYEKILNNANIKKKI